MPSQSRVSASISRCVRPSTVSMTMDIEPHRQCRLRAPTDSRVVVSIVVSIARSAWCLKASLARRIFASYSMSLLRGFGAAWIV